MLFYVPSVEAVGVCELVGAGSPVQIVVALAQDGEATMEPENEGRKRNMGWRIDWFFVTENLLSPVSPVFVMLEEQALTAIPLESY
jgi:hypothetical protein